MKSVTGTRGNDNYLVHSTQQAVEILTQNPNTEFLIQEFIPNDGDYRAIVAGSEVRLLIHRTAVIGSHKNNTSQGGAATLLSPETLSPEALQACVAAAQAFDRDIAGVDIVFDKRDPEKFYFFEVNRSPQIEASSYSKEKAIMLNGYFNELIGNRGK